MMTIVERTVSAAPQNGRATHHGRSWTSPASIVAEPAPESPHVYPTETIENDHIWAAPIAVKQP